MKNTDRCMQRGIVEIGIELSQVGWHHQPLVGHHLRRQAAQIKTLMLGFCQSLLGLASRDQQARF